MGKARPARVRYGSDRRAKRTTDDVSTTYKRCRNQGSGWCGMLIGSRLGDPGEHFVKGKSIKEIARPLNISRNTVRGGSTVTKLSPLRGEHAESWGVEYRSDRPRR